MISVYKIIFVDSYFRVIEKVYHTPCLGLALEQAYKDGAKEFLSVKGGLPYEEK